MNITHCLTRAIKWKCFNTLELCCLFEKKGLANRNFPKYFQWIPIFFFFFIFSLFLVFFFVRIDQSLGYKRKNSKESKRAIDVICKFNASTAYVVTKKRIKRTVRHIPMICIAESYTRSLVCTELVVCACVLTQSKHLENHFAHFLAVLSAKRTERITFLVLGEEIGLCVLPAIFTQISAKKKFFGDTPVKCDVYFLIYLREEKYFFYSAAFTHLKLIFRHTLSQRVCAVYRRACAGNQNWNCRTHIWQFQFLNAFIKHDISLTIFKLHNFCHSCSLIYAQLFLPNVKRRRKGGKKFHPILLVVLIGAQ